MVVAGVARLCVLTAPASELLVLRWARGGLVAQATSIDLLSMPAAARRLKAGLQRTPTVAATPRRWNQLEFRL